MSKYEGTVQDGRFRLVSGEVVRVTSIQPQEARAPYDMELGDDGSKITIEGDLQGGWIYSARIIQKGS